MPKDMNDPGDLRDALRDAIAAAGMSQTAAAKQIGVSAATLSQWLGAKYGGDNAAVDAAVARWLDARGVAASAPRPLKIPFQRTDTAARLWAMMEQAQHVPSIVVGAGVPGIGKTSTAKAYRDANPSVWLVTLDPVVVSPAQVLAEIADAIGVQLGSHTTLRNRIGERIKDSGGLLIIDEAQHMNPKALDMVRSLHDRYEIGIALIGNFGLFGGTAIPSKTHGMAQFFRRVSKRAKFDQVTARDAEMILDAWQVHDAEQRKFLALIASKPWGLGGVKNVMLEARTLAAGEGVPMALRHMRMAWAGLNHFEERG